MALHPSKFETWAPATAGAQFSGFWIFTHMPAHRTFFPHFGWRMGLTRKPARVPNDVSLGLSWVPRPGLTCLAALLGPVAASGISFSPF